MANERQQSTGHEDNDLNQQVSQDPAEAGRKAIEASKLTNDSGMSAPQQQKAEEKDAEQWRNEG